MNFEVFNTVEELEARIDELKAQGVIKYIDSFNGSVYTLKWTSGR